MVKASKVTKSTKTAKTEKPAKPSKGLKERKVKKKDAKPKHAPTSVLVGTAIESLKSRRGASLQAIKKYIATHHKVNIEKLSPHIRKYLKTAVDSGKLIHTKGKGASGSFKMATTAKPKNNEEKEAIPNNQKKKEVQKPIRVKVAAIGTKKAAAKSERTSSTKKSVKKAVSKRNSGASQQKSAKKWKTTNLTETISNAKAKKAPKMAKAPKRNKNKK